MPTALCLAFAPPPLKPYCGLICEAASLGTEVSVAANAKCPGWRDAECGVPVDI